MIKNESNQVCHHGHHCVLQVPIFRELEGAQIEEVSKLIHTDHYDRGTMIFRPNQPAEKLYVVNEGQVKVYRLSDNGKEQLIRILLPGDFAGELSLVSAGKHDHYAETLTPSAICSIAKSDFDQLLVRYPAIAMNVLHEFARRLNDVEKQATNNVVERTEKRIAKFLLDQCPPEKKVLTLPMNKKLLASYLGTTPESLSRVLHSFEEQGWISLKTNKIIMINNLDALANI